MKERPIIFYAVGFALLLTLSIGGWIAGRQINYVLQYEGLVRDTVREMVKPESLKVQP